MGLVSGAMIDKIIIINDAGIPLYEWSSSEQTEDGSMLSGFLAALNTYAQHDRGEQITKITLDPTTFMFRRERDLVFTILTKDPELEKIITLILDALKEKFLGQFGDKTNGFEGGSDRFRSFDRTLQEILGSYGYSDYEKAKLSFASDSSYKSFLVFGKETGEPLYAHAREYIPRKSLGFQVPIVIRAAERLVSTALREQLKDACLLSMKLRCLSLRSTPIVQVVNESVLRGFRKTQTTKISDKSIRKVFKRPERLLSSVKEPFIIFDESGAILLANDKGNAIGKLVIPADCIAVWQSSKNIFSDVYKEDAWASFLLTEGNIYSIFGIDKYIAFLTDNAVEGLDTYSAIGKVRAFYESLGE